jgi:hypothetical protein
LLAGITYLGVGIIEKKSIKNIVGSNPPWAKIWPWSRFTSLYMGLLVENHQATAKQFEANDFTLCRGEHNVQPSEYTRQGLFWRINDKVHRGVLGRLYDGVHDLLAGSNL